MCESILHCIHNLYIIIDTCRYVKKDAKVVASDCFMQ